MGTILITGGTGFVGHYLTAYLRQKEPTVRLILTSQAPETSTDSQITIEMVDLTKSQAVDDLIKKYQPEQIYHLASIAHVASGFSDPRGLLQNNFTLTLNLLEAVRQFSPTTRILLVSSADLYDHDDPAPIDEKRLVRPLNPYAVSKATQDMLGQAYAASFGLPIIIVRPFNHIGPGQRRGFVVADFASKLAGAELDASKRRISVGNLEAERDFTDVRDMVSAYYLLMNQGKIGEIYNAGSGRAVKISDLLQQMIALVNVPIEVVIDQEKFRPVDYPQVLANASKLQSLGWRPQIPLAQTLAEIIDYWRGQLHQEKQKEEI